MTDTVLTKTIYLKATPARVWDYLTDPEKLKIWFHKPDAALAEGPYEMFGIKSGKKVIWGTVLVAEPFTRLEYTFSVEPMGGHSSMVKWALDEVPGGTKLSLRHEGLMQGEEAFGLTLALDEGWDEHMGRMRVSLHEG